MVFVLYVNTRKGTLTKLYSRNSASTEWERSHHTPTQYAPKTALINTTQLFPFPFNSRHWSRHGNDYHSLVCHCQQCETKWRNAWKWGPTALHSWRNCRIADSVGQIPKCGISLNDPFKWRICHLLQCERQKCDDLVKEASTLQAGDWA